MMSFLIVWMGEKFMNYTSIFRCYSSFVRSNLNKIFGVRIQQSERSQLSTSQQQQPPATSEDGQCTKESTTPNWIIQTAKVVTAYKDGIIVGKVGTAFLSSAEEQKIILYKTKVHVLATLTLGRNDLDSDKVYRQDRYLQFFDDARHYWSLLFEREDDEKEFLQILTANIGAISDLVHTDERNEDASSDAKNAKVQLVARVAKVGLKLPNLSTATSNATECSDSSDAGNPLSAAKRNNMASNSSSSTAQYFGANSDADRPVTLQENHLVQMLLAENRTQNTELRMNVSRMESKIEKVLERIELLDLTAITRDHREDELLRLEETLLAVRKENRRLKETLENRLAVDKSDSFKEYVTTMAQQLKEIQVNGDQKDWRSLCDDLIGKAIEYQKSLDETKERNATLDSQLAESMAAVTLSQEEAMNAMNLTAELQAQLKTQEQRAKEELREQKVRTQEAVKGIMNNLYGGIVAELDSQSMGGDHLRDEQIITIVGRVIKEEALRAIENL